LFGKWALTGRLRMLWRLLVSAAAATASSPAHPARNGGINLQTQYGVRVVIPVSGHST
jgi:hypothetical protein